MYVERGLLTSSLFLQVECSEVLNLYSRSGEHFIITLHLTPIFEGGECVAFSKFMVPVEGAPTSLDTSRRGATSRGERIFGGDHDAKEDGSEEEGGNGSSMSGIDTMARHTGTSETTSASANGGWSVHF